MTQRRIALYEDERSRQFEPLSLLRPVFELTCGHGPLRERLQRALDPASWGAIVREALVEVYREEHPHLAVNDYDWLRESPTLLVNGRWLGDPESLLALDEGAAGVTDGIPVALTVQPHEISILESEGIDGAVDSIASTRRAVPLEGMVLNYPWELVERNREWLVADFNSRVTRPTKADINPQTAILGSDEDIFIHPTADVDPFVVIDARGGPVWVEESVKLQAFTRIEGPCFVGRGSQLFRANVKAGTTIGPQCRIGGELEECIIHGFANKYHDGFLGHGYVCPWVNLGALTTNSDLKNDYSTVRVVVAGNPVETGSQKVGCFIGDHAKTAIGSFLNTGTSIGALSLILPAGELLPKFVPPFSRLWHGVLESLDDAALDAAVETARIAMSRRGQSLTDASERLLRQAFRATASEREAAILHAARRRAPQ